MKNNKLLQILEELGLTENEAKVYLSALSLGPTAIQNIATAAETKRTTVYSVVDALKQKGLMNVEFKGLKKLYVVEDPQKLENILETKQLKFKKILPEFEALYNLKGGQSLIKYYEGLEGVRTVYNALLRDTHAGDQYNVISNTEYWYNLDQVFFQNFLERRAQKKLHIRLLLQNSPFVQKLKQQSDFYKHEVKILPTRTSLTTNLIIIPNRVVIQQLNPPIMGVTIENKSIITMHQEMFEIMWKAIP
jgi:HTH-type transcriptional regulator, sugar sensing transcriptional regulator